MSLHNAAKHLAAHGRGPDTTLVHMTPREVNGLQAIAKAHGGSLTINPHTGLAEAGFLSRILPTLAGAALAATGVGAPMAAMLIGGGTALAKGDLKAGLMAGLGAYGGAGLMGGAATMGAEQVATEAGREAGLNAGAQSVGVTPEVMATPAGSQAALSGPSAPSSFGADAGSTTQTFDPSKAQQYSKAYSEAYNPTYDASNVKNLDNTQLGLKSMMSDGSGYLQATGGGAQAAQYGLAALAPGMVTSPPPIPGEEKYDGPLSRINMGKDYKAYQAQQPNPYYQPRMYNYAGGGPIEQMSNANAMGANTGYPMADVNKAAYSTPYQTPISQNVVTGSADTGVNPMTGEMNFAGGGNVQLQGHVTMDDQGGGQGGQFGQASANGYQPMGGGQQGGMMGGLDPRAVAANPQGFQQFMQGAQQQEMQRPGSTMFSQLGGAGMGSLAMAQGGVAFADGGHLGGYSDGGRMLKGPGDGMSDSIPAQIGAKQPARLADGEFVVPADVVSHLGNGSTDAGAKQLYSMMDRIRAQRTGKKKQAPQVNPKRAMPA